MIDEVECSAKVWIPAKNLDKNGLVPRSSIVSFLLKTLLNLKASEEYGYFLAVTKLKSIGNGDFDVSSKGIYFPVSFICRTFLPVNGEVMLGVVHTILTRGVFLKCGPMKYVFLPVQKMPNYHQVPGKKPLFLGNDGSRIESGLVVRFLVFGVRWTRKLWDIEREFMIIASLEGDDCLGPVSLPGADELDS